MTIRRINKNSTASAIEIVNRQRSRSIDEARWRQFAARALKAIDPRLSNKAVTLAFVGDRQMRELNYRFRGRRSTTDVLSFPAEALAFEEEQSAHLGDIAISLPRAATQAAENCLTFEREVAQLILHGLLHLCGYDHEQDEGEMNRLELNLRRHLRI